MHRTEVTEVTEGGLGSVRETFAGDIVGLGAKIRQMGKHRFYAIPAGSRVSADRERSFTRNVTKTIFNAPPNFPLCDLCAMLSSLRVVLARITSRVSSTETRLSTPHPRFPLWPL